MSDDGDIHVVVEGEPDDTADAGSSAREIERLNRQADADRATATRAKLATAHYRREGALRKIDSDLLTLDSEERAAESAYRTAREFGDVDAEVAATKRLSAAESRRHVLAAQRGAVEQMPISSGDGFEDHLSKFTEPTAQWMRQHRDWVEDPRKNSKLVGAHHMAIADGLTPDSSEYFSHVERTLGMRSRGNGSGNRDGGNMQRGKSPDYDPADHRTHVTESGVYLTPNERKLATDGTLIFNTGPKRGQPIGIQEMARRKSEMSKQGLYNKLG